MMASKRYRKMMAELDQQGITVCINRIGPKRYQLIIDFVVRGEFMRRQTCNDKLRELHILHAPKTKKHER